jgi:hypothetical protein
MKLFNNTFSTSPFWIREAANYLIALSLFILILSNRSPNVLRPLSMNVRFGFGLIIPLLLIILFAAFHISGWLGKLLSLAATSSLFALGLAGVWASGHTQSVSISGLLPLYDAQSYYVDALRLLAGRSILEFSAARPLYTGVLAALLAVTGRNLMIALASLTAINALACYFASREIQRTHGSLAAVFLLVILFLYYRYRTIGTAMSENLGFPLGVLGVTLIWRGIKDHSDRLVLYGLFINTVALNARPGAFFVLPAMLLWGSWYFRESGKRLSWRFSILGLGVIGLGFVLNTVIMRLIGVSSSVPFAQFSYAIYGVASGGNSWSYVFQVHPELLNLSEPEKTRTIYHLTFELIRNHPMLILQGAVHNWSVIFSNSWYNLFSFVSGENNSINILTRWTLYGLSFLGIIKWIRNISDPYTSFSAAATLGVLLSVPFVPPADSYGMRLYAATIMIIGLLPTMGLVFILENLQIHTLYKPSVGAADSAFVPWLSALLIMFLTIGPLVVRGTSYLAQSKTTSCQPNMSSVLIQFDPGSYVSVIKEKQLALDWLPVFHQGIFKRNAHGLTDISLVQWLEDVPPATTLFNTLDYKSNKEVLIALPTRMMPADGSTVELCGTWEPDPSLQRYNIFVAEQATMFPG